MTAQRPATVVLVHGAFHGAWCWQRVEALLAARGVRTVAVDRRRGNPLRVVSDLFENARIVRAAIDAAGAPVVLAGHSAGGPIVTEASASNPAVRHLVYIAARMPAGDGDPLGFPTFPSPAPRADVTHPDGSDAIDAQAAARRWYNDCDAQAVAWATAQLVPQERPRDERQAPRGIGWREHPSTYAVCLRDQALAPEYQRLIAERATHRIEWDTGHSPFLSQPELVADLLERLARENS